MRHLMDDMDGMDDMDRLCENIPRGQSAPAFVPREISEGRERPRVFPSLPF